MTTKKTYEELANALEAGARQYKYFQDGAELANLLVGMGQNKVALEKEILNHQKEIDGLKEEKLKADKAAKTAQEKHKKYEAEANEAGAIIIRQAETQAAQIVTDAQTKAQVIGADISSLENKKSELATLVSDAQTSLDKLNKILDDTRKKAQAI